jgi:hypothetical protein
VINYKIKIESATEFKYVNGDKIKIREGSGLILFPHEESWVEIIH